MADPKIVIDIRARIDNLKQKLAEAQKTLAGLKTGADKGSSGVSGLFGALKGLVAGAVASGLLTIATRLYEIGAAGDRAERSLNTLTQGNAAGYIEGVGNAAQGTVADIDAMAAANRALRLGVVQSERDMEQLTKIAIVLGRTMGMDATTALNDLVTGIGRASPMILDNLGLTIKQADIQEEVNRLMAENASLSESDAQKRATLNLAIREGNELLRETGGIVADDASEVERLTAHWKNFQSEFGKDLSGAVAPLIKELNDLIDKAQEISTSEEAKRQAIAETTDSWEAYAQALTDAGLMEEEMNHLIQEGQIGGMLYGAEIVVLRNEFKAWREALDEAAVATHRLAQSGELADKMLQQQQQHATAAAKALKGVTDATLEAADAASHMAKITKQAKEESGDNPFEGLFGDVDQQLKDAGKAGLQGVASLGKQTEDEADEDTIRQAVYQAIKSRTDDPVKLFKARKALGLATEGELAKEAELLRIVELYASGRIDDSQLAAAVAALESGNMEGSQAIQGTALDPNRPSNQPRQPTGQGTSRNDTVASPYPNATQADRAGNNGVVRVHITADDERDAAVGQQVASAIMAAINAERGTGGISRPRAVTPSGGHRVAR